MKNSLRSLLLAGVTLALSVGMAQAEDVVLKASHQWPGGTGDVRDEMVQILAKEAAVADVGLDIRIYPGKSLFKPKEQWGAMVKGQLDISAFPLDYAGITRVLAARDGRRSVRTVNEIAHVADLLAPVAGTADD